MVTGHTLLNTINSYMDCTTSYFKHWHTADAQMRPDTTTTTTIHHCCITVNQARAKAQSSKFISREPTWA